MPTQDEILADFRDDIEAARGDRDAELEALQRYLRRLAELQEDTQ